MIAKMKCSNCGAEMSNLTMSWGRKQWLVAMPIKMVVKGSGGFSSSF